MVIATSFNIIGLEYLVRVPRFLVSNTWQPFQTRPSVVASVHFTVSRQYILSGQRHVNETCSIRVVCTLPQGTTRILYDYTTRCLSLYLWRSFFLDNSVSKGFYLLYCQTISTVRRNLCDMQLTLECRQFNFKVCLEGNQCSSKPK